MMYVCNNVCPLVLEVVYKKTLLFYKWEITHTGAAARQSTRHKSKKLYS
jgi:hypothetical protein